MRKQQKEPSGIISLNYGDVVLPLSVAHQIQALLAQAVKYERQYGDKPFGYYCRYRVPDVAVHAPQAPVFDATMLDDTELHDWVSQVGAGLANDPDSKARDITPPEVWLKLKGE